MAALAEIGKSPVCFDTAPVTHGRDQGRWEKFIGNILGRPLKPKGHWSISGLEGRSIDWLGENDINSLPDGDNEVIINSLLEKGVTGGLTIERRNGRVEKTVVILDKGNVVFREDPFPSVDPRQINLF